MKGAIPTPLVNQLVTPHYLKLALRRDSVHISMSIVTDILDYKLQISILLTLSIIHDVHSDFFISRVDYDNDIDGSYDWYFF